MPADNITRQSAFEVLANFDPIEYEKSRNYVGFSSRISAHLSRGVITKPEVLACLAGKASVMEMEKFVYELAWREYYQRVWDIKGDLIYTDLKWPQKSAERQGIPAAVIEARTGIKALDEAITKLYQTGYIHNHERMWLAGLVCNIAKCHWLDGANWMYYHLLDGEISSNHLSWQWVAGSFSDKEYLPVQSNINTYSEHGELGTYLDYKHDKLARRQIPLELSETVRFEHKVELPSSEVQLEGLGSEVMIMTPWTISDEPNQNQTSVLLIDEELFSAQPVSNKVMTSITDTAKLAQVPIYIGKAAELAGLRGASARYHPSIAAADLFLQEPDWLFPDVEHVFYPSFTSFWKQAQPLLPDLQRRVIKLRQTMSL